MAGLGSSRYYITNIGNLIKNYVEYESASARAMLSDMILNGDDVIDALDNAGLQLESDSAEYDELDAKYKALEKEFSDLKENNTDYTNLIKNLESLIKGKEGPFIDNIKDLLKK